MCLYNQNWHSSFSAHVLPVYWILYCIWIINRVNKHLIRLFLALCFFFFSKAHACITTVKHKLHHSNDTLLIFMCASNPADTHMAKTRLPPLKTLKFSATPTTCETSRNKFHSFHGWQCSIRCCRQRARRHEHGHAVRRTNVNIFVTLVSRITHIHPLTGISGASSLWLHRRFSASVSCLQGFEARSWFIYRRYLYKIYFSPVRVSCVCEHAEEKEARTDPTQPHPWWKHY